MDGEKLLELYRQMVLMRRFEEEAAKAYTERKIGGFLHLYIGQEAVGVGVIGATHEDDYIITAYRDHGHYLACGGTARRAMAELFGKEAGCAGGRGGSMHFFDAERGFLGGHGIVGAHIPLGAGAAFASKYRNDGKVTVCFFGEGAASIGPFHEALCLASLWKLPIVFVIENNGYAMGTPQKRSMALDDVSVRGLGYPMARVTLDGVDVVECYEAAEQAISRARNESLPTLLEFKTYRYRGHSMADPAKYRTKEELQFWKEKKEPLILARKRLEQDFPEQAARLEAIHAQIEDEVMDAVRFAHEAPDPDPATVERFTYV